MLTYVLLSGENANVNKEFGNGVAPVFDAVQGDRGDVCTVIF